MQCNVEIISFGCHDPYPYLEFCPEVACGQMLAQFICGICAEKHVLGKVANIFFPKMDKT